MLCQQLGLKVKSFRRGRRNEQERYYRLDRQRYQQVIEIADRRQQRRLAAISPTSLVESPPALELVVRPPGLNQTDEGDYEKPPRFPPLPRGEIKAESKTFPRLPNRFVGQKAFEGISDRVRRQVDLAIGGLRLFGATRPQLD